MSDQPPLYGNPDSFGYELLAHVRSIRSGRVTGEFFVLGREANDTDPPSDTPSGTASGRRYLVGAEYEGATKNPIWHDREYDDYREALRAVLAHLDQEIAWSNDQY